MGIITFFSRKLILMASLLHKIVELQILEAHHCAIYTDNKLLIFAFNQ